MAFFQEGLDKLGNPVHQSGPHTPARLTRHLPVSSHPPTILPPRTSPSGSVLVQISQELRPMIYLQLHQNVVLVIVDRR
jgi:hypothetical protein